MTIQRRPAPVALAALLALTGCSATLHLYPIEGPLAERQPAPVLRVHARGISSGTLDLTLPDGEHCLGPWTPVLPGSPATDLAPVWDEVYGPGFHRAHILGAANLGRAILRGPGDTTVTLEFFKDTPKEAPLQGVARDNRGNRYKFTR